MALRVRRRGAAEMGQQEAVAAGPVARVEVGLAGIDVEAGGEQLAAVERREHRLVVEQRAAGGVDQERALGQQAPGSRG